MRSMTLEQLRTAREPRRFGHLAAEIQDAIDDPRPNLSYEAGMAEMGDADITELEAEHKPARRKRA